MTRFKIHEFAQRSEEWEQIRMGRVGSSEAIGLSTDARMRTLLPLKVAQSFGIDDEDDFTSKDMQRGIDLEPEAVEHYTSKNLVIGKTPGYVTNEAYKYGGLSPDLLLVTPTDDIYASVEIKSPRSKKHVQNIIEGLPKEYEAQVAWHFVIMPWIEYVDFVSYCPDFTPRPMHTIRVTAKELEKMIATLKVNYTKFELKMDEARNQIKSL